MKMYSTIEMIFAISLLFCVCASAYGQEPAQASNGLYNYVDYTHQLLQLNKGDKEFAKLNLDRPIKYYSEEYDSIFQALMTSYAYKKVITLRPTNKS